MYFTNYCVVLRSVSLILIVTKIPWRKCDVWQCLPSSNRQQDVQTFLAHTRCAFHKAICKITEQTFRFGKLPVHLPKVMSEDTCKALFVPTRIESPTKIVSPMLFWSLEAMSPLPPLNFHVCERFERSSQTSLKDAISCCITFHFDRYLSCRWQFASMLQKDVI